MTTTIFTATDTDGSWELELIEIAADGWHYGRVITAPPHMLQWVGNRMDFPPNEIASVHQHTMTTTPNTRPAAVATLPATPRKIVLTPLAKATLINGWSVLPGTPVASELAELKLIDEDGVITDNGQKLGTYLHYQFYLGKLAEQVRAENIDGEDLADLATGIDAGEETGSITGTSVDFQLAFALAASLADCSAEDLRSDLEAYLGW